MVEEFRQMKEKRGWVSGVPRWRIKMTEPGRAILMTLVPWPVMGVGDLIPHTAGPGHCDGWGQQKSGGSRRVGRGWKAVAMMGLRDEGVWPDGAGE